MIKFLKLLYPFSLKADHDLEIDQLKRTIKTTEEELEEFRAKTSDLQRQLTEERIDKQYSLNIQLDE